MAKTRVYELAKELGLETRDLLAALRDLGEFVRSASSTMEVQVVRKLREKVATSRAAGESGGENLRRNVIESLRSMKAYFGGKVCVWSEEKQRELLATGSDGEPLREHGALNLNLEAVWPYIQSARNAVLTATRGGHRFWQPPLPENLEMGDVVWVPEGDTDSSEVANAVKHRCAIIRLAGTYQEVDSQKLFRTPAGHPSALEVYTIPLSGNHLKTRDYLANLLKQAADEGVLERQRAEEQERQRAEEQERRKQLQIEAEVQFETDVLKASDWFRELPSCDQELVDKSLFNSWVNNFVEDWVKKTIGESEFPDSAQAAAIAPVDKYIKITARAGSGKTLSLVTRVLFLMEHCGVCPDSIFVFAFNKDAAAKVRVRIRELQKDSVGLPIVRTFHAFAKAFAGSGEISVLEEKDSRRLIEEITRNIFDSEPETVRSVFLDRFKADWDRFESGNDMSPKRFEEVRQYQTAETFAGDTVKSFGEHLIANTLFRYGVDYAYEDPYPKKEFPYPKKKYRPDFTMYAEASGGFREHISRRKKAECKVNFKSIAVIEYFGKTFDDGYLVEMSEKRKMWAKEPKPPKSAVLIEREFGEGKDIEPGRKMTEEEVTNFELALIRELRDAGVKCLDKPMEDDEVFERIRRGRGELLGFSDQIVSFINRAKQLRWSPLDLTERISSHPATSSERSYLDLAVRIYAKYIEKLEALGKIDFSDMIWKAVDAISDGTTTGSSKEGETGNREIDVRLARFLLIDEYQDFSRMFLELVQAIRKHTSDLGVFAVGDDWQAINRFAGSDLSLFEGFPSDFEGAQSLSLVTNYRSDRKIVECGNKTMENLGPPARASSDKGGQVLIACYDDLLLTRAEKKAFDRNDSGKWLAALVRLLSQSLSEQTGNVAVLLRTNQVHGYSLQLLEGLLREELPEFKDRIEVSTVHKYKGLEASVVIIADATTRRYPFIHPNWDLNRIFGENIPQLVDDERRLFYVAQTRARHTLYFLVPTEEEKSKFISPKIEDIVAWGNFPPPPHLAKAMYTITVMSQERIEKPIRKSLKELGFDWEPKQGDWGDWELEVDQWEETWQHLRELTSGEGAAYVISRDGKLLAKMGVRVTISDGYDIKEDLKKHDFRWTDSKEWVRVYSDTQWRKEKESLKRLANSIGATLKTGWPNR